MKIYAKTNQTYEEHISKCYENWKYFVEQYMLSIEMFCVRQKIEVPEFLFRSLLCVLSHDLGKVSIPFQQMIKAKINNEKHSYSKNYRHELISFPFVILYLIKTNKSYNVLPKCLEAWVVLSHHKLLVEKNGFDVFQREKEANKTISELVLINEMEIALQLNNDIIKEAGESYGFEPLYLISFDEILSENPLIMTEKLLGEKIHFNKKDRELMVFLKAILTYSDWFASSNQKNFVIFFDRTIDIERSIEERCKKKEIEYNGLNKFQKESGIISSHVLAVAPTGSGKTEAGLNWAVNICRSKKNRIVYLLPTQVTSNSIFERISEYLGSYKQIGLVHSQSIHYLKEEYNKNEDFMDSDDFRSHILKQKVFYLTISVSTLDQFLSAMFHTKHWTIKEFNFYNTVFIIDEIQCYDDYTLGLLSFCIKYFSSKGAKFYIMSATFPSFILEHLKDILDDVTLLDENNFDSSIRAEYKKIDKCIFDDIHSIKKVIEENKNENKKTLIVLNTIDEVQKMSKLLSNYSPFCYHSRFIRKHRKEKEKEIIDKQPELLIASQVVEVSLDIDYDTLLTQNAPPDSLIQRAGRINRYRNNNMKANIFIYKHEKKHNYIYAPQILYDTWSILDDYNGFVSEKQLKELYERVYKNKNLDTSDEYKDGYNIYDKIFEKCFYIFDNSRNHSEKLVTRLEKYEQINVIPKIFRKDVIDKKYSERNDFELTVPYGYYKNHISKDDGKAIFCEMGYNNDLGGILYHW